MSADTVVTSKRLMFTFSHTMVVDVDPEEAGQLLEPGDFLDVVDAAMRFRRITGHDHQYLESDLTCEDATDTYIPYWGLDVVDGINGREKYLWSARHFVIEARTELSRGRYREGNCPELDAVNRDLAVIEDRLRLMAIAAESPLPAIPDPPAAPLMPPACPRRRSWMRRALDVTVRRQG